MAHDSRDPQATAPDRRARPAGPAPIDSRHAIAGASSTNDDEAAREAMRRIETARRDLADIRAVRAGDRCAGDRIAARLLYVPRLLSAMNARRSLGWSRQDLEDASQDVMAHVWGRLEQFRGEGSLEAWLYRFCENEVRNRSRLTRRRRGVVASINGDAVEPPVDEVLTKDVAGLLDELGPPDAPIVRLKHFEGMTFEEMSQCLGIATSTAKSRYYRGIDWLRRRFGRSVEGRGVERRTEGNS